MFNFQNKEYELRFNMKRIEMIEAVTNMPTMASLSQTKGMLKIVDLKAYFGYSVKENGSDIFMPPKEGMELAEQILQDKGYSALTELVLTALERDCPFFFQEN